MNRFHAAEDVSLGIAGPGGGEEKAVAQLDWLDVACGWLRVDDEDAPARIPLPGSGEKGSREFPLARARTRVLSGIEDDQRLRLGQPLDNRAGDAGEVGDVVLVYPDAEVARSKRRCDRRHFRAPLVGIAEEGVVHLPACVGAPHPAH
jgi:hypothetical protein